MTNITRKFDKGTLVDILYDCVDGFKIIEDEIVDQTRWSTIHWMIFQEEASGKYYGVTYSHGSTECQDESPFEYDPEQIDCVELEPVEVTKVEYREKKGESND